MIKVICVTDCHHPSYFFENGYSISHSEEEFIDMMCKPHTENYSLFYIFIESFEEDEESYDFIESFERMTVEEIKNNFSKLYQIYLRN